MKVHDLISDQKNAFRKGLTRPYETRIRLLKTLRKMVAENEKELCDAIKADFGKPYFESFTGEIFTVLNEIDYHLKHLSKWMKPRVTGSSVATFPSRNTIYQQPFGTVLIIGAWNYPVHLTLMPLTGALSAGNTLILKPSELAPATSSLIKKLFDLNFPAEFVRVVEGSVEETEELLLQPFDKIFFTGSSRVGKIVMKAAAEQLIPVTLELGGKSPAIVHHDANIEVSAKRIWWGKTMNAGQICVAPDFALVHESVKEDFVRKSKSVLGKFFRNDYIPGENYTRIVNQNHFDRLQNLLDAGNVIFGGSSNADTLFIEPTLIDAGWDDEIMKEEVFGPLLPLLTYKNENELIERLCSGSSPLALYLFTENHNLQELVREKIPFGGSCINDTISHLANPNLPFGGVGKSGMGSYHGRQSFETFSRSQSVLKKSFWPDPGFRYPPYDQTKLSWFKKLFS